MKGKNKIPVGHNDTEQLFLFPDCGKEDAMKGKGKSADAGAADAAPASSAATRRPVSGDGRNNVKKVVVALQKAVLGAEGMEGLVLHMSLADLEHLQRLAVQLNAVVGKVRSSLSEAHMKSCAASAASETLSAPSSST